MKFKLFNYSFSLFFVLFGMEFSNAEPISKSMTVTTQIDRNDFFSGDINIHFSEDNLVAEYNEETKTFRDLHTSLIVESTMPSRDDNTIQHVVSLTKNLSTCSTFNDEGELELIPDEGVNASYSTDLVDVFIEQQPLTEEVPVVLPFSSNESEFKQAVHDFSLTFGELPSGASRCSGEIEVMVEFDL